MNPDHAHMLVSIPLHLSVLKVVQYIKGKSSRKLQGKFQELKKRYLEQHLCTRKYFVLISDQISIREVQKYVEEQESQHKNDLFKIFKL